MSNYGSPQDPNEPKDPYGQQGGQPEYGQQGGQPDYGQQASPYGAAPQYDPAAVGGVAGQVPVQENKKAQIGLYLSIAGICCGIFSIAGIILGIMAKSEIKSSNGQQTGDQKATAAIIVGAVLLVIGVIGNIVYFSSK